MRSSARTTRVRSGTSSPAATFDATSSVIDEKIEAVAANWTVGRMPTTDRNAIRLGAFELLYTDTPPRVAIDEALELAKSFGSANSSAFVNGVLDRLIPREKRQREANPEVTETED